MKNENSEEIKKEEPKQGKKEEAKIEELHKQLESLRKEKDEIFGKLQRVSADYLNFQKRTSKQIEDTVNYEKEKIIKSILPVLDNFELTLQNAADIKNAEELFKGVQIIYDHLLDILKSLHVEQIKAFGVKFEPSQHEAIAQRHEPDKEDNLVLEEYQKGYKMGGRLIRPSRVIVNKLPARPQVAKADEDETKNTK